MIAVVLALSIIGPESVRGSVRDSQRHPIAGAGVIVQCGGHIRETRTSGNGSFVIEAGVSDPCDLIVTAPGFQPVFLPIRERVVEIELTPARWDELVEVRGQRFLPAQVATALPATVAAEAMSVVGPDPARWLMLAARAAGDPLGTRTLIVNGLPASVLPSTEATAAITAAADPFSVEAWGVDRIRLHVAHEPPSVWKLSASPGLFSNRSRDVLLDNASQWSQHRAAHVAGPVTQSGRLRMFASATSTSFGGSPTYVERRGGADYLAADVDTTAESGHWASGLFARHGPWTVNASIASSRMDGVNAGVGGRFAANAAGSQHQRAAAGQMTFRRQGRRAILLGGVSHEREQRSAGSSANGAAVMLADRLLQGAPEYVAVESRASRTVLRVVAESATLRRGWLVGVESRNDDQVEHRTTNPDGVTFVAETDARPAAQLRRRSDVTAEAATNNFAVLAQQVVANSERAWIRIGVRGEYERGMGYVILPRVSAGWRMGPFIAGANAGRFAETWSATDEIERLVRSMPAQIITASGDVLTLGLAGRGDRRTDTVARASLVRTFKHVSLAVEETVTLADHLTGLTRHREAAVLIDTLDAARSLERRQTHLRMDLAVKGWLANIHYQHTSSRDDAPGTFALPAWQRNLSPERGPSSGIPQHSVTMFATGRAPLGARVLFTGRFQTGVPYSALTGADPDSLLTFSGRLHALRNHDRFPSSADTAMYVARQTTLGIARLVLDAGMRVENLLGSLVPTEVERSASSTLFGQPVSAAAGRRLTVWATLSRR